MYDWDILTAIQLHRVDHFRNNLIYPGFLLIGVIRCAPEQQERSFSRLLDEVSENAGVVDVEVIVSSKQANNNDVDPLEL